MTRRGTRLAFLHAAALATVSGAGTAWADDDELPEPVVRTPGQPTPRAPAARPGPDRRKPDRPGDLPAPRRAAESPARDDLPAPVIRVLRDGRYVEPSPTPPPDGTDAGAPDPAAADTTPREGAGAVPGTAPPPAKPPADDGEWQEPGWDEEEWNEEEWSEHEWNEGTGEEAASRWFLYKEAVVSGFYSVNGIPGLPASDMSADHYGLSPRPPGTYVALEYIRTFSAESPINRCFLPSWLPLTAIDLHPRVVYDPRSDGDGLDRVDFAPQDFWLRFNPGRIDRLSLRIGQFVLPYGVNPVLAPRQQFILPVEAIDLGLKWDWGIDLKGPAGEYDWEVAATIGSGEALYRPYLFSGSDRTSYLVTGRIGAPTYWDFQYGASFLFGDLRTMRGPTVIMAESIARWRVGLDAFYRAGTYLMAGAQITYGGDEHVAPAISAMTGDSGRAGVLGGRAWVDYVMPACTDLRFAAQFESVIRDVGSPDTDDTAVVLEAGYSLTDSITLKLDYRWDIHRVMGGADHAFYLTFVFYGE